MKVKDMMLEETHHYKEKMAEKLQDILAENATEPDAGIV